MKTQNLKSKTQSLRALAAFLIALTIWFTLAPKLPAQQAADAVPTIEGVPDAKVLGEIIRFGGDVNLQTNEVARHITVIGGSANVDGAVKNSVVVLSGTAKINGPVSHDVIGFGREVTVNSKVGGEVVVLFGSVKLGPDAEVKHGVRIFGGPLDKAPTAVIEQEQWVLDHPVLRQLGGWLTQGVLFARPLPPGVGLAWTIALLFLAVNLLLSVLFPRAVQSCVDSAEARPVGSVFAGLLVMLLVGPLGALLIASGIGILAIPFLLCAVIASLLIGKVAVYRYVGRQLGRQFKLLFLERPSMALIAGTFMFYVFYMIPLIGFIAWGLITLLGFGSVVIAVLGSFRRDSGEEVPTVLVRRKPATPEGGAGAEPDVIALPRVGFWLRFTALALDAVLLLLIALVLRVPPLIPLIWLAYHVGMWTWRGTTLGGLALGIKIVRTDGSPVNFAVALVRSLASLFSALVLFLGFFWAGWSRERQSWHDMIAGTAVVRVPREMLLV